MLSSPRLVTNASLPNTSIAALEPVTLMVPALLTGLEERVVVAVVVPLVMVIDSFADDGRRFDAELVLTNAEAQAMAMMGQGVLSPARAASSWRARSRAAHSSADPSA